MQSQAEVNRIEMNWIGTWGNILFKLPKKNREMGQNGLPNNESMGDWSFFLLWKKIGYIFEVAFGHLVEHNWICLAPLYFCRWDTWKNQRKFFRLWAFHESPIFPNNHSFDWNVIALLLQMLFFVITFIGHCLIMPLESFIFYSVGCNTFSDFSFKNNV